MKILLSGYHNPHFITITEYVERAIEKSGHSLISFDDREFTIPGRIRQKVHFLQNWDLGRLNNRLVSLAFTYKPDLCLITGGHRILPTAIEKLKALGVITVLWVIDAPLEFEPIIKAAPRYDFVFTGGSEAYDILKDISIEKLHLLPFGCDSDLHRPHKLTGDEEENYACDIAFVGTVDPKLYDARVKILEAISDFNLGVWGPGSERIPVSSPLREKIRGDKTIPDVWTKIYSQTKIVLCLHYKDPERIVPCYQASPRIFEALACGGFVISDDQKDVFSLFKEGEHLARFIDSDDLIEKIAYYLDNRTKRREIALRGMKEVLDKHTYVHRIETLLSVCTGGTL